MEHSKLPFAQHFSKLREYPRWVLKLIVSIILLIITAIVSTLMMDYNELYKDMDLSGQQLEQAKAFAKISGMVGGPIGAIIGIGIAFLIFWAIARIMKSNVSKKSIFSATLSYTLITTIVGLVILLIQWAAGLSVTDYNIASLNIFDKGNNILKVFNLQNLIGAYVFGVMLYATFRFSKKSSIIWAIIYLIVFIVFGLIGAAVNG